MLYFYNHKIKVQWIMHDRHEQFELLQVVKGGFLKIRRHVRSIPLFSKGIQLVHYTVHSRSLGWVMFDTRANNLVH